VSGQTPTAHPGQGVNGTPTLIPPAVTGEPSQYKTTSRFGQMVFPPMPNFDAPPRGNTFR
jgi:hypothetical protein